MSPALSLFIEWFESDAADMFILGKPGTGKTYTTATEIIPYIREHYDIGIKAVAFTNQAARVLREALLNYGIDNVDVTTIHKFAGMVPIDNQEALKHRELTINAQIGEAAECYLLIVDEFSFVDQELAGKLEELRTEGKFIKCLYLGDMQQLKPISGKHGVRPRGQYQIELLEIKRSDKPDIQDAIIRLHDLIKAEAPDSRFTLKPSANVLRASRYEVYPLGVNDTFLAFRNATVQQINALQAGRTFPVAGDILFSPTTKDRYEVLDTAGDPWEPVRTIRKQSNGSYELNDKTDRWNTRGYLDDDGYPIFRLRSLEDEEDEFSAFVCFGTESYRSTLKRLKMAAMDANQEIMDEANCSQKGIAFWCNQNPGHPLTGKRKRAWAKALSFESTVFSMDFNFCRTVHAAQGSSFDNVYMDIDDMRAAGDSDTRLRLQYVGLSRARNKIFILK